MNDLTKKDYEFLYNLVKVHNLLDKALKEAEKAGITLTYFDKPVCFDLISFERGSLDREWKQLLTEIAFKLLKEEVVISSEGDLKFIKTKEGKFICSASTWINLNKALFNYEYLLNWKND